MAQRFYALTVNGAHHQISEETATKILQANNSDLVELDNGTITKVSVITEVMPEEEYKTQFPQKAQERGAFQPYSEPGMSWEDIKQLSGSGFDGIINLAGKPTDRRRRNLEALLKGLRRAKQKLQGIDGAIVATPNVDNFIKKIEEKLRLT